MTPKHFEEVWEESEKVAKKQFVSREGIYGNLHKELEDYAKLENIPSGEIRKILKTKKLGEILFRISEISRLDDINTYAALQMQIQYISQS